MIRYIIGVVFVLGTNRVLLINKQKPAWQRGYMNFPGGKVEPGENVWECAWREFREETNLNILPYEWECIGEIRGTDYTCSLMTTLLTEEESVEAVSMTPEEIEWVDAQHLPFNVISNIPWLLDFARNWWKQGNYDSLQFGIFVYGQHHTRTGSVISQNEEILNRVQGDIRPFTGLQLSNEGTEESKSTDSGGSKSMSSLSDQNIAARVRTYREGDFIQPQPAGTSQSTEDNRLADGSSEVHNGGQSTEVPPRRPKWSVRG